MAKTDHDVQFKDNIAILATSGRTAALASGRRPGKAGMYARRTLFA
jgi:hypothetical protein